MSENTIHNGSENKMFTNGDLIDLLDNSAKRYITGSKASVIRNKHMNNLKKSDKIDQDVIDAVVVDFINFVGGERGIDVGMYVSDLRGER
jgi:hypothetical protein